LPFGNKGALGVCATRRDAIRQAQTFIDAVVDWAALVRLGAAVAPSSKPNASSIFRIR